MDSLTITSLVIGLALIGLSNLSFLWTKCSKSSSKAGQGYVDKDGEATIESLKALGGKWSLISILVLSAIGLGCGSATTVLFSLQNGYGESPLYWSQFSGWVCIHSKKAMPKTNSLEGYLSGSVHCLIN